MDLDDFNNLRTACDTVCDHCDCDGCGMCIVRIIQNEAYYELSKEDREKVVLPFEPHNWFQ